MHKNLDTVFDSLPPAIAARAKVVVASREDGRNVHFINESAERDRFSFTTLERADAFRAQLNRAGREVLA